MKKINKKGFTLIELLAVIVIMGILMLVAIPAMQRYITNSRKDTYINTVKEYVNAVKTAYAGDALTCSNKKGTYAITFAEVRNKLLESGGESPFKNSTLSGYIRIVAVDDATNNNVQYDVSVFDAEGNGFMSGPINYLARSNLSLDTTYTSGPGWSGTTTCTVQ